MSKFFIWTMTRNLPTSIKAETSTISSTILSSKCFPMGSGNHTGAASLACESFIMVHSHALHLIILWSDFRKKGTIKEIVNEITTLRRHLESMHPVSSEIILDVIFLIYCSCTGHISKMGNKKQFRVQAPR